MEGPDLSAMIRNDNRNVASVVMHLGQLNREVRKKYKLCARPLLLKRRNLVLRSVHLMDGGGGENLRLTGCSFHLLKYGVRSMIIQGTHRPK